MVDWQSRMLHILGTKNEERIHIPLNDAALVALRLVRLRDADDLRIFRSERAGLPLDHIRHWFDSAWEEAKISGLYIHGLRHTFASRLRGKGAPQQHIAELPGYKGFAITRPNAQSGPRCLHEVVARLPEKPMNPGAKPALSLQGL